MLYDETMTLTMIIQLMRTVMEKCGPIKLSCWTSSIASLRAVLRDNADLC